MDYFVVIILTIIIIVLLVLLVIYSMRKANSNDKDVFDTVNLDPITSEALEVESVQEGGILIPIERLPATTKIEEKSLFEITNRTVIARISETIPTAVEILANTITNKALKNVELYKAVIPSGAVLADSKQMEGAVRGFYQGAKGIKGQANFVKVDPTNISKATKVANGVANVMNVGSLVVGQYYMSEINSRLETMSKNVSKISDFQDREFKSRILSLIARVGKISNFSSEILESDDLRNCKLQTLDDLEGEGTQLLQQVNLTIDEIIKKNQKPDYREYQEKVDDFRVLTEYQQMLVSILEKISKLTYLLGKGQISYEMSYSIFNAYLKQSNQIRAALEGWHEKQVESLGIDIDKNRISKKGIEGFFAAIPGFVDDNLNYKELKNGLGQKINAQKSKNQLMLNEPEDVYGKDVQIIIKDGKYYYLHESSNI